MTPKTTKSHGERANRAQIERTFLWVEANLSPPSIDRDQLNGVDRHI